jgi:hypothetical protein
MTPNLVRGVLTLSLIAIAALQATPCAVRAPFANVNVPPYEYYYYEPDYPPPMVFQRRVIEPALPSAAGLAALDASQLDHALREISRVLHAQLRRFNTSDSWQNYLRLREEALDTTLPRDERTAALAAMLERFRNVAADPQYSMIARLSAFQAMEAALNEAISRTETGDAPSDALPDAGVEDLPLPAPQRPAPQPSAEAGRDRPFFTPRSRQ